MAEAQKAARYVPAVREGLRTKLYYALAGAGLGAMVGVLAAASSGAENRDAALTIGIGAAAGGLVGLVVGTFKGGEAATHAVHDDIAEAFQRCMKERGYTVMRERRAH